MAVEFNALNINILKEHISQLEFKLSDLRFEILVSISQVENSLELLKSDYLIKNMKFEFYFDPHSEINFNVVSFNKVIIKHISLFSFYVI